MLWCAVGMGFFLAWTVGNAYTKELADIAGPALPHVVDVAAGVFSNVLALVLIAAFSSRVGTLACRRRVRIAAGACAIVGPLIMVASVFSPWRLAVVAVGSMLKGVASALLFVMLSEAFCHLSMRKTGICYSAAYVLSVLLQALMGMLHVEAAFVLELVCAVVSAVSIGRASVSLSSSHSAPVEETAGSWAFPWYPLILCAAFTLVAFLVRQLIADSSVSFSWLGGGVVSLVCLVGCLVFYERRFDATALGFVALPLMISGILLWCWAGSSAAWEVLVLTDAANVSFRIFFLVVVCDICFRYGVSSLWLFALVRAAMMLAEGLGLGVSLYLESQGDMASLPFVVPAAYVMVVVLVTVSMGLWRTRGALDDAWHMVPKVKGASTRSEQLRTVMSSSEVELWKCNCVARLYGLTHREEEILSCLVRGKTRAQIEEELVLSESTVRTHMRHLYAKLGVHSQSEAVELVDKTE